MKLLKYIFLVIPPVLSMGISPVLAAPASLQQMLSDTTQTSTLTGSSDSVYTTIGLLINTGLSLLGIVFLLLILRAGLLWMTSQGDSKKITKAKDTMITAVIGLVILLAAVSISNAVIGYIAGATG